MLKQLVFATNNANKLSEVRQQLKGKYTIVSLDEIGCHEELPETTGTIEGNAKQKAEYVFANYNVACFADDTGLEIDALNGEPGVDSAHYAGPQRSSDANMDLVLKKLENASVRSAQFKTVMALVSEKGTTLFEGIAKGSITNKRGGAKGFGYDPIFRPNGSTLTFAEMTSEEKSALSHRGKAVNKLVDFLLGIKDL